MAQTEDTLFRLLAIWSLLLLLATASGHIHSPDGEVNYRTTRSLSSGGGYAMEPLPDGFLTRQGKDGREYPQYGPLQPLLTVPLVWVGGLVAPVVPTSWLSLQQERLESTVSMYRPMESRWANFPGFYPDNHSDRIQRSFASMFNPMVTWLTVLLLAIWAIKFKVFGGFWWVLPVVYLLGTYAWPHSRPSYTEPLATLFLVLACFLAWESKQATDLRGLFLLALGTGVIAAAAVLTRLDSSVALPGILIVAVGSFFQSELPRGSRAFSLVLGAVAFISICSWIPIQNQLRFGSFFASGYEDQKEGIQFNIPLLHAMWIYLVSPGKGIFWYSPPLLAALVVWPIFFRRERFLCLGFAWIALSFLLIIGKWQNLGGWCWGPRHLFQITPFVLFPLPILFSQSLSDRWRKPGRLLFWLTFFGGMMVQILGILVDFMWPLDKTLRTMSSSEQTGFLLSVRGYGPLLHWHTWRLDRDPDWLTVDLWRSGEMGAQIVTGVLGLALVVITGLLARAIVNQVRLESGPRQQGTEGEELRLRPPQNL